MTSQELAAGPTDAQVAIKKLLLLGIAEIPEVGGLIAGIIDILWDDGKPEGWESIRERTEKLVRQELTKSEHDLLTHRLEGMRNVMQGYADEAANSEASSTSLESSFRAALANLTEEVPSFKGSSSPAAMLPLFVQAATLHLSLLRDGVLHGQDRMAMAPSQVETLEKDLARAISDHSGWVRDTYATILGLEPGQEPADPRNRLAAAMTVDVLDYVDLWPYLDPKRDKPGRLLTREVFSRVYGAPAALPQDPPQPGYYPSPPEGTHPVRLRGGYVSDVPVGLEVVCVYLDDGTNTGWMGNRAGVTRQLFDVRTDDHGGVSAVLIDEFPHTLVRGVGLRYEDGTRTLPAGVEELPVPAGHYLSSVQVASDFADRTRGQLRNDLVRSVWFGFRFTDEVLDPLST